MHRKPLITVASFPPVRLSFYFDPDSDDRDFCEALDRQLTPLKLNGQIQTWDDRQILAGQEKNQERERHLSTDHLLILLISPDFLASEACQGQMDIALQRHLYGDAAVIPILVRPCLWEQTALKTLQILPREQRSLGTQPLPEALQEIALEIDQVIHSIQQRAFVAYAPEDGDFVERLHRDLAPSSVRLWSPERKHFTSDLSQNKEVRAAMRDAFIVLLIASSATASSSVVKAQMALAADYHRPVLVVWAGGQDGEQPRPGEWKAEAVIDARAERYERACTELVVQVKQQERMISASQTQTELFFPEEPRNPYKGLHAFTTEDARDFFGREALVDELMKTDNSSEVQKPVPGTLRVIEMVIPGVRMIRTYQRCWLRADLVATVLASVAAGSR